MLCFGCYVQVGILKDIKAAKTYYKRSASKGYLPAVNAVERLKQVN